MKSNASVAMKLAASLVICAFAALWVFPCFASPRELYLKWNELPPLVLGHEVTLVLPIGSVIGGEAVAIRGDALVIDIRKTSDGRAYPRGQASIPRASVSFLQVIDMHGSIGRHVGTVAGVLGGLMLAGAVVYRGKLGAWAGVATYITIPICTSAGGHQIGRRADERVTRIKIVAD